MADAIRQIGVSEVTFYRWREELGGLKTDQLRRLKELELEFLGERNALLTRLTGNPFHSTTAFRAGPSRAHGRRWANNRA